MEHTEKTLSPYFFVHSDDPHTDQLPLKATQVAVNVAGVIADVTVTQIYTNTGTHTLEAIYVFPASTRAAVYGLTMAIGTRTIVAVIKEREQARQEYETAKREGKSASLLEQQRPNVFQMNVANILPGDEIKVELRYTELLIPTDGVYEFMYPTVVGPRYSNQPEAAAARNEQWVSNPYLPEGQLSPSTFNLTLTLAAGLPVQEMRCVSHQVNVNYESPTLANLALTDVEKQGGNRDFILQYRLSGGQIESGLLLYQAAETDRQAGRAAENFFLLMVQPPQRVTVAELPPREYIFILDVSGSMHGFPLDTAKVLMQDLLGQMRPTDCFNMLLFSFGSGLLAEQSLPATPENIKTGLDLIRRQSGGGGTELLPALQQALQLPRPDQRMARTLVVVTDGFVDVEPQAFDLIRQHLGEANLFAFGIGSSVNRHLIEGMARVGMGEPFIVTQPAAAAAEATRLRQYIQSPVLTQLKADFREFDVSDLEPLSIPDVLAQRPVLLFGKWQGEPEGTVTLTGLTGGQPYHQTIRINGVQPLPGNVALRYLWARHKITLLGDYNNLRQSEARVKEITTLGLTYNLLTAYTSFVAIDSAVRYTAGETTTVQQPLPLPAGVSNAAVGAPALAQISAPPSPYIKFAQEKADPRKHFRFDENRSVEHLLMRIPEKPAALTVREEKTDGQGIRPRSLSAQVPRINVTIHELRVAVEREASAVEFPLHDSLPKINAAYQAQLSTQANLRGKVELRWIVRQGMAAEVTLVTSELHCPPLEEFLIKLIQTLQFAVRARLGDVAVTCILQFEAA